MSFSEGNEEKIANAKLNVKTLDWTMSLPQILMLTLVFILGLYLPEYLSKFISNTVVGF